jgi:tRNA1Val (adenine37-N6)-methyltransferase
MTDYLKENEKIDDLQRCGLKIIQNPGKFCFGMDAVLLSGFMKVKRNEPAIDLGTGTGIIPILLTAKTEGISFTGLEIQKDMADMARRSVEMNGLLDKVKIVNGDIKEADKLFGKAAFGVVSCNPPYMAKGKGKANPEDAFSIARHEVLVTLEDVVRQASLLLRPLGRFYMVHRPLRLAEIFEMLNKYSLEPKRMKMVHPFIDSPANMVLIEAVKGGGKELITEKPIIVYKEKGVYTDEIHEVYGY